MWGLRIPSFFQDGGAVSPNVPPFEKGQDFIIEQNLTKKLPNVEDLRAIILVDDCIIATSSRWEVYEVRGSKDIPPTVQQLKFYFKDFTLHSRETLVIKYHYKMNGEWLACTISQG